MSKDRELLKDLREFISNGRAHPEVKAQWLTRIDARLAESQPIYDDAMSRRLWLMEAEKPQGDAGRLADWEQLFLAATMGGLGSDFKALAAITDLWPNKWHQDCAAVAFLIHSMQEELAALRAEGTQDALKAGDVVCVPREQFQRWADAVEHGKPMRQISNEIIAALAAREGRQG